MILRELKKNKQIKSAVAKFYARSEDEPFQGEGYN